MTSRVCPPATAAARNCQGLLNVPAVVVKYTVRASGVMTAELICADAPNSAALTRIRLRLTAGPGAALADSR